MRIFFLFNFYCVHIVRSVFLFLYDVSLFFSIKPTYSKASLILPFYFVLLPMNYMFSLFSVSLGNSVGS